MTDIIISTFSQNESSFCDESNYLEKIIDHKEERCGHEGSSLWLHKWFRWENIGCKLAMHAKLHDEIWKSMIHDLGSWKNNVRNRLEVSSLNRFKSCCHHSLSNLCGHTDNAWWKLKSIATKKHW